MDRLGPILVLLFILVLGMGVAVLESYPHFFGPGGFHEEGLDGLEEVSWLSWLVFAVSVFALIFSLIALAIVVLEL